MTIEYLKLNIEKEKKVAEAVAISSLRLIYFRLIRLFRCEFCFIRVPMGRDG